METRSAESKKAKKADKPPAPPAPPSPVPQGNPEAVDEVPSLQAILVYEEEKEEETKDGQAAPPVRDLRTRRG
ncbi:MAG TPA: hypothetical protein VLT33_18165 [Labilithrix sp.]|nr:hypothetical protein [Labilithrix sp.]